MHAGIMWLITLCADVAPFPDHDMSMWDIVSYVRIPALLFGAGTAIGELPPYFIGRAGMSPGSGENLSCLFVWGGGGKKR